MSDWDDYISQAAEDAANDAGVAQVVGDLHDAADAAHLDDTAGDAVQFDLDNAAYQGDFAQSKDDWADWHAQIGESEMGSAHDYAEHAGSLAASGDLEGAASAMDTAQMYADQASGSFETAADYGTAAAGYLADAADDVASAVSSDATSVDVGSANTSSFDTSSFDPSSDL